MASRATAALLAALLVATPALAQPTSQDRQVAGDLVKKAIAKGEAGDHQGAIETYLQAYTLIPQPLLLSNIGSEYQKANKPVEALKYFCLYLEKDPTGTLAPFATAQAKVLQLQLGNKDVDERAVCAAPKPDPAPPAPAQVRLETREGTTSSGGGAGLRTTGVALGLVGIVGLAVGGYYIHRSMVLNDKVENTGGGPYDDDVQADQDAGPEANTRAWVFGVSGGALLVGGIVLYFVGRSKRSRAEHVSIAPTNNGFAVFGSF